MFVTCTPKSPHGTKLFLILATFEYLISLIQIRTFLFTILSKNIKYVTF